MHPAWLRCSSLKYSRSLPVFSVVAPCQPGASPPSVRRRIYEMSSNEALPQTVEHA